MRSGTANIEKRPASPRAGRRLRVAIALVGATGLLAGRPSTGSAEDDIDRMLRRGHIPMEKTNRHGYSDFTDPLGRFLDLLAAGAFAEARAIQPDACAAWIATRQDSAFTGKVSVWDTEINLDTLCVASR
jgi:hypothetical protein